MKKKKDVKRERKINTNVFFLPGGDLKLNDLDIEFCSENF